MLGIWGAFVPTGMIVAMMYTPWLLQIPPEAGLAIHCATYCTGAITVLRLGTNITLQQPDAIDQAEIKRTILKIPLAMAGCFTIYSGLFVMVTSFFPTVVLEWHSIHIGAAATLGALIVAGNILGNIAAGFSIRAGVR